MVLCLAIPAARLYFVKRDADASERIRMPIIPRKYLCYCFAYSQPLCTHTTAKRLTQPIEALVERMQLRVQPLDKTEGLAWDRNDAFASRQP